MQKILKFFFIYLLTTKCAFAADPDATLGRGHREAMMGGGGITNVCSPGQVIYNPAGVYCADRHDISQSFGSTNFSIGQISHTGDEVKDLQKSDVTPAPGMTLFSQTTFEAGYSYGFFGQLGQMQFDKYFNLNVGGSVGGGSVSNTQSSVVLGGFYAWGDEDLYWGANLYFQQKTEKGKSILKYMFAGDEYVSTDDSNISEHFLGSQLGLIKIVGNFKYAVALNLPRLSLSGDGKENSTVISANGSYVESFNQADVQTSDSWQISTGFENNFDPAIVGFDVSWTDRSKRKVGALDIDKAVSGTYELGTNFQYRLSPKMSLLSGLRFKESIAASHTDDFANETTASLGLLRFFKSVELGTSVAYLDYMGRTAKGENSNPGRTRRKSLEFTFSSAYSY